MKQFHFILAFIILLTSCKDKTEYVPVQGKWIKGTEQEQMKIIETQLRGLDMAMVEIGYRYQELYWAGQDEHWEFANYQLKKIEKALKLGLQRRPNRAKTAQHFLNFVIPEVKKTIKAKNKENFNEKFNMMRQNCTACHAAGTEESYPTFTVQIPNDRQSPIRREQ
ncbi:conserved protein of unknown function [Tenacibaculum sp. 190524A02b]|uniref:hypothetical protein n=1 Tax=Tenacibaculum vairaonense TaxID=3137860 RepID=UPI0032B246EA